MCFHLLWDLNKHLSKEKKNSIEEKSYVHGTKTGGIPRNIFLIAVVIALGISGDDKKKKLVYLCVRLCPALLPQT